MAEPDAVAEFFDGKGAVGLFCVINPAGSQIDELCEQLPVSEGTLRNRLDEAEELGLLRVDRVPGEHDTLKLWVPTDRGIEIYHEMRARQIPTQFYEYRAVVREYEREREAFTQYMEWRDGN